MLSVIILAYNSASFIGDCVGSVLAASAPSGGAQVIVLDNGSADATWAVLSELFATNERVELLHTDKGLGFAGGCNFAASFARGDLLLFLNDDCTVEPMCLCALTQTFARAPELGIAQCVVATADGESLDTLGHLIDLWGFLHPVVSSATLAEVRELPDWHLFGAAGAAIAVRRTLFNDLHGFDESFEFLFEESDMCWRALLLGAWVGASAQSVVYHKHLARYFGNRRSPVFYLESRNRLASILANLSFPYALSAAGAQIVARLLLALSRLLGGEPSSIGELCRAIGWNIANARRTWEKRRRVQSMRVVTDRQLIARRVIMPLGLAVKLSLRATPASKRSVDVLALGSIDERPKS